MVDKEVMIMRSANGDVKKKAWLGITLVGIVLLLATFSYAEIQVIGEGVSFRPGKLTPGGTISMDRDREGKEILADIELTRIALPRRVYSISHIEYAVDRINWLYNHRDLIKGLKFVSEPPVLRFFDGRLKAIDDWGRKLADTFKKEIGNT